MIMEEKVLSIMKEVFENTSLKNDCSQSNCESWDSLHHLALVSELEGEFEVEFEPEEINVMTDLNNICSLLKQKIENK